jgi:alanyl-tRNA synthetase
MDAIYNQNKQVSAAFSAKILETGEAARHMNEVLEQEKYSTVCARRKYFALKAETYRDTGFAICFEDDLNSAGVRELATAISETCNGVAAVFSGRDGEGYSLCLAGDAARVKTLGNALNAALGSRGGGKPGFYQGSIPANRTEIMAFCTDYRE